MRNNVKLWFDDQCRKDVLPGNNCLKHDGYLPSTRDRSRANCEESFHSQVRASATYSEAGKTKVYIL